MSQSRTALLWSVSLLVVVGVGAVLALWILRNDRTRGVAPVIVSPSFASPQRPRCDPLVPDALADGAMILSSQVHGRHRQIVIDTVNSAVF